MVQADIEVPTSAKARDAKEILDGIGETLANRPEGDLELTNVLIQHILTTTPDKKPAEVATARILELAESRAKASIEKAIPHG